MPSAELVEARNTYKRAEKGPSPDQSPAELHVAKEELDKAEAKFANDGNTDDARDRAYIATRRAEIAEAQARLNLLSREKASEMKQASGLAGEATRELAHTKEQLAAEKKAREEAEKKMQQAMTDLARIASVKQESRGMVITLSGEVLFQSGQSTLMPAAMVKLNDVADALVKNNPDSRILVEGHTDSQGKADYNRDLSQKRAQAVRDYLVSRGIAADRVRAEGLGPDRPVADNKSPEGRANNRRVEIVVSAQ
jgi:outer membrane protein OmpA-like peptidoglycan-associated protein